MTERKPKLTRGDHGLAQVLVRPVVFSVHTKLLKIQDQECVRESHGGLILGHLGF
jgi:hypothetical protein